VDSRATRIIGHIALAVLAASLAGAETATPCIALFPTQNRAGDSAAAEGLDRALWLELSQWGQVIEAGATRDALRRLRLRNGDHADAALLRRLGEDLQADWLVSTALHDADRRVVPRVSASARVYSATTGELVWAGFRSASGLDGRGLLGRGTVSSLDVLVPMVVRDLVSTLPDATSPEGGARVEPRGGPGTVAVIPFGGSTKYRATLNAETVTEATRARLFREGVRMLSPNEAHGILRRIQGGRFGGVTAETRAALHDVGGADTILTGAVEAYETGGSELEPDPEVIIAMRLLDGATGRILWTDALERTGRDGQGLFASGRVYARGALANDMVGDLAQRLEQAQVEPTRRTEGRR